MAATLNGLELVYKCLADQTRLRILGLLRAGEICVCHIHDSLGLPQTKVSRHLAYLRRAGLVQTRRQGLWIYYRLAQTDEPVVQAIVDLAVHAVGHVSQAQRDVKRLQRENHVVLDSINRRLPVLGCCPPPSTG